MCQLSLVAQRPCKCASCLWLHNDWEDLFDLLIEAVSLAKTRYPDISYQFNCCVQKDIGDEIDELVKLTEDMGLYI